MKKRRLYDEVSQKHPKDLKYDTMILQVILSIVANRFKGVQKIKLVVQ